MYIYTSGKKYDKLQLKSYFKNLSLSHTRSYDFVIERLLVIISGKKSRQNFLRPENAVVGSHCFWSGPTTDRTTDRTPRDCVELKKINRKTGRR